MNFDLLTGKGSVFQRIGGKKREVRQKAEKEKVLAKPQGEEES